MEDQQLLKLLVQNNQLAFAQLYDRYWKKLYAYAYTTLKDTKQCQDIVQDVFVSLWERRADLDVENLNAYLYSCVRYKVYKCVADRKVKDEFFIPLEELAVETHAADNSMISAELRKAYQQLLEKMPAQRKKIFQMRYDDNMTTRSIAEQLNIAQKTVQNQLLTSFQQIQSLITSGLIIIVSISAFFHSITGR